MIEVISAVYENGVLKPLKDMHLKEHQRVKVIVQSNIRWAEEFKAILAKIHQRTMRFSSTEIENDITKAYHKVRSKNAQG